MASVSRIRAGAVAALLAVTSAACSASPVPTPDASTAPAPTIPPAPEVSGGLVYANGSPVVTVGRACVDQLAPFLAPLFALHGAVAEGISPERYAAALGAVQTGYQQIAEVAFEPGCLDVVGVRAEDAMNEYAAAAETWAACTADPACEEDSIRSELTERWARASTLLRDVLLSLPER